MAKLFFVPQSGNYRIVLDSDSLLYGGHQRVNDTMIYPIKRKDGRPILEVYYVNRKVLVFEKIQ